MTLATYHDLFTQPLWQEQHLGMPIPPSEHAVSVAMPLWSHVVGYEEKDPAICERLQCGYPRFLVHPRVRELNGRIEAALPTTWRAQIFPSVGAAERCLEYIARAYGAHGQLTPAPAGLAAVAVEERDFARVLEYWRYTGEIVSSRRAAAALAGTAEAEGTTEARRALRERIAETAGQRPEDVLLFPSGMGASFFAQRMLQAVRGPARTAQVEFPYVDVYRVQKAFGPGAEFFAFGGAEEIAALRRLLAKEKFAGVYCELPNNPLLRCPDIEALSSLLREHETPTIADDTMATSLNVDAYRHADAVTSSLTKFFGGVGDVMAGSLVLNRRSPFYGEFAAWARRAHEDQLWGDDAVALERESRDYGERVARINENSAELIGWLKRHPDVEQVWHPAGPTAAAYDAVRRPGGGEGGMFSLLLRNGAKSAPAFYDALRVSKGPSLGTNYTLACPYTLLAHYDELEWAEQCGIPRWLIRVSIGLEDADDLARRFEEALRAAV